MVTNDDERWLPAFLREHGYRGLRRQHDWCEYLVWHGDERWLAHGPDDAAALSHLLAQMFPSAAARSLLAQQDTAHETTPAVQAAAQATSIQASAQATSAQAIAAQVTSSAHAASAHAASAPPPATQSSAQAPTGPPATALRVPEPTATEPATPAPAEPERRELPKVGERLILPTPAYPPAAVAEARDTLDEILKEMAEARPDFAVMAPRLQKVHMLGWICRARGLDEQFAGEHKVTVLVRRVAHELTTISKIMWPGSVQALQMSARPDCVVGELGVKTSQFPRTWNDASEYVLQHRDRAILSDVPLDDYGWADDVRRPPPGDPRTLLREAQHTVESVAGPAQEPPPRHLNTPPEDLGQESIDQLVKHVQQLRAIRLHTLQPELWGCVIGRLRWLSGRLGDRAPALRKWLDPEFRPPVDNTRATAIQSEKTRLAQQASRDARAALSETAEPAVLGTWLLGAFAVFNTAEVAALVGEPLRAVVLELDDDALPDADRRLRRRLRDLKAHLQNASDLGSPGSTGSEPDESDTGDTDARASEDSEPVEVVDDSLTALVRARVRGNSAHLVSNRDDPDLKANLEEQLGLDISWCDGNPRKVQAQCESIARNSYDLVLIATGFQAHMIDGILARAARAGGVPYVRVFKGRPLACVRALARSFGLQETS